MSNLLNDKVIQPTDISEKDENFLKEFSKDFYHKIINTNDFNEFEITLSVWINNLDKNAKTILELMENHKENKFLFSGIIGFFYQYGISCEVDKNKSLELYLLAINDDEFKETDNKLNSLQNINHIIGKYLLSLFYYKNIILNTK